MWKKHALFIAFLIILSPVQAEFDIESYQDKSFSDIKAHHTQDLLTASLKNSHVVSRASFKYRIPVTFSQELRKLSGDNKTVLKAWQQSLRVPEDFIQRYQHEFRAEFDNETYWIPVQEELLLPMGSELHAGDKFVLYVVVIGAINNKLVMLATEFKSARAPE